MRGRRHRTELRAAKTGTPWLIARLARVGTRPVATDPVHTERRGTLGAADTCEPQAAGCGCCCGSWCGRRRGGWCRGRGRRRVADAVWNVVTRGAAATSDERPAVCRRTVVAIRGVVPFAIVGDSCAIVIRALATVTKCTARPKCEKAHDRREEHCGRKPAQDTDT